jgi:hypothetical protein
MPRIVLAADEPIDNEQVGNTLDALSREAQRSGDLRDRYRGSLQTRQDPPSGTRLAGRPGQRVSRSRQKAVKLANADGKRTQSIAGRRADRWGRIIDSMLSYW